MIASRKLLAKVYGKHIIPPFIKLKKYREHFTEYINLLRLSKNFRDRQMYIKIARHTYRADNEIFKKHFAKNMGNDMIGEKVKVVQITLAKLLMKIPASYSRSSDKLREHLMKDAQADVK